MAYPYYAGGGDMMAPPMPPMDSMPDGGADSPEMQLQQMVGDYAATRDPEMALAIADMMVELMGMGAAQAAPMTEQPMMGANGMQIPHFKKGGSIKRQPKNDYLSKYARGGGVGEDDPKKKKTDGNGKMVNTANFTPDYGAKKSDELAASQAALTQRRATTPIDNALGMGNLNDTTNLNNLESSYGRQTQNRDMGIKAASSDNYIDMDKTIGFTENPVIASMRGKNLRIPGQLPVNPRTGKQQTNDEWNALQKENDGNRLVAIEAYIKRTGIDPRTGKNVGQSGYNRNEYPSRN